jgi:hypothetical protein
VAARLCRSGAVVDAALKAAGSNGVVFDDLVELGLARGRITRAVATGLARHLVRGPAGEPTITAPDEETAPCES